MRVSVKEEAGLVLEDHRAQRVEAAVRQVRGVPRLAPGVGAALLADRVHWQPVGRVYADATRLLERAHPRRRVRHENVGAARLEQREARPEAVPPHLALGVLRRAAVVPVAALQAEKLDAL